MLGVIFLKEGENRTLSLKNLLDIAVIPLLIQCYSFHLISICLLRTKLFSCLN